MNSNNPRLLRMLSTAFVAIVMVGAPVALAGKPAAVIEWSNGFPSGEHYNLNIHGKKAGFACDGSPGGASVFVPEYGDAQIDIIQNKRSSLDSMYVRDACGTFDGDSAQVQLPSGEYQVYARILAKPQKAAEAREVILYPKLVETCNDSGTANFTDAVDCQESFLMGTGVITTEGAWDLDSQSLTRTAGKTKAVDVTGLFQWTGWACDQAYDVDGDGAITAADAGDLNGDGVTDQADLDAYLASNCTFYSSEWVFNIADLVVYGWDYHNNGSKLLQVRFYPTASTTFG